MDKHKNEYICPDLAVIRLTLRDVICSSPENFNSYLDSEPGDWGDPILDPDDDIGW